LGGGSSSEERSAGSSTGGGGGGGGGTSCTRRSSKREIIVQALHRDSKGQSDIPFAAQDPQDPQEPNINLINLLTSQRPPQLQAALLPPAKMSRTATRSASNNRWGVKETCLMNANSTYLGDRPLQHLPI